MPRIEMEDEVKATPEQVWALLSDANRFAEWVEFTERMIETPDGPMAVGSTWREYGGLPPFKSETQWHMAEFDAPRRQVQVGENNQARIDLTLDLTPSGEGTRVRAQMDAQPRGLLTPIVMIMWPLLMRGRAQRAMADTFANAKRILESESG